MAAIPSIVAVELSGSETDQQNRPLAATSGEQAARSRLDQPPVPPSTFPPVKK
jgi:hypothetical protein